MKNISEVAKCSKAVKKELKNRFPNILFSVYSESFSMGDAVNVHTYIEKMEDFITEDDIKQYTNKYEYGHFDGMTDYYNADNVREDIPQTKYLQVAIEYSPAIIEKIIKDFNKYWNGQFIATTRTSESSYFKNRKVGIYESKECNTYYWIREYINKHIKH